MYESLVQRLNREVKYHRVLLDFLVQKQIPSVLYYSAAGRTVRVKASKASILVTLEPRPGNQVRMHLQLGTSKPLSETFPEQLLLRKLHDLFSKLGV